MQLYAITDRRLFARREELLEQVIALASGGVDYIQIREKDLPATDLWTLTAQIAAMVRSTGASTRVLLNGPAEMAADLRCDGVHLTADMPGSAIMESKAVMSRVVADPVVSVSCHTLSEIERARDHDATLALFAPVFEKKSDEEIVSGQGLDMLAGACRIGKPMPVLALGGVTAENAHDCVQVGAAGIAAIRLFTHSEWYNLRLSR
jgi:thiamine-phosphate pyrophosphorylase